MDYIPSEQAEIKKQIVGEMEANLLATGLLVNGKIMSHNWQDGPVVCLLPNDVSNVVDYVEFVKPDGPELKVSAVGSRRDYYTQSFKVSNELAEKYKLNIGQLFYQALGQMSGGWQDKTVDLFMKTICVGVNWNLVDDLTRTVDWNFSPGEMPPLVAQDRTLGLHYGQISEARSRLAEYLGTHKMKYKEGIYLFLMPNRLLPSLLTDENLKFKDTGKTEAEVIEKGDDCVVRINMLGVRDVLGYAMPMKFWLENGLYSEDIDGQGNPGVYCYMVYTGNLLHLHSFGNGYLNGQMYDGTKSANGSDAFLITRNVNQSMGMQVTSHVGLGADTVYKNAVVRVACRVSNFNFNH